VTVRIRMKVMGRHKRQFFRLCAIDSRCPRDGKVIEELGYYDPMVRDTDARAILKGERIAYWLSVGAKPSEKAEMSLASRSSDVVLDVKVKKGDVVKPGQVLAVLDTREEEAELKTTELMANSEVTIRAAEATARQKELEVKRMAGKENVFTQYEVDKAKLDLDLAQLDIEKAQVEQQRYKYQAEQLHTQAEPAFIGSPGSAGGGGRERSRRTARAAPPARRRRSRRGGSR